MRWILDGYNIILTDEVLGRVARNDLQTAREKLIGAIASAALSKQDRFVLIFDGRSAGSTEEITPNLEVRFTRIGSTADDLIKTTIGESRKRRTLFVVSNDHSIAEYARECGANAVSSEDFLSSLRDRRGQRRTEDIVSEKPAAPLRSDPELLKLFREKKRDV